MMLVTLLVGMTVAAATDAADRALPKTSAEVYWTTGVETEVVMDPLQLYCVDVTHRTQGLQLCGCHAHYRQNTGPPTHNHTDGR